MYREPGWTLQLCTVFVWSLCCFSPLGPSPLSYMKMPFSGFRLAASRLCLTSGTLCLHMCAAPLYFSGLFWLVFIRTHFSNMHMFVWLCICRHLSACAQCVASSFLPCCLHKAKWYLCLSSLPESSFNCKLNRYWFQTTVQRMTAHWKNGLLRLY